MCRGKVLFTKLFLTGFLYFSTFNHGCNNVITI